MRSAPSTSTLPRSAASEQPDDPYKVDAAAEVATTTVDTPDNGNTKSSTVRTLTSTSEVSASDGVDVIAQANAVTGAVESDDGVLDKTDSETAVMNDGGSDVLCDGDNSGIGVLEKSNSGLEPRGRSDQAEEVHNTKREQHKVAPRVVHKAVISKEEEKRMKKQQEREDKERKEKAAKEAKAKKEQHKEAEATKKGDKSHLSNAP